MRFLAPRHTFESVVLRLIDGLRSGEIVLSNDDPGDAGTDEGTDEEIDGLWAKIAVTLCAVATATSMGVAVWMKEAGKPAMAIGFMVAMVVAAVATIIILPRMIDHVR